MQRDSRNSSGSDGASAARGRRHQALAIGALVACLAASGCSEEWQRKFIRKPKARSRFSPIVTFEDYTKTITPLDRYRKHYALFQYWNAELLDALGSTTSNPKRVKKTSAEALEELKQIEQDLLPYRGGLDPKTCGEVDRTACKIYL